MDSLTLAVLKEEELRQDRVSNSISILRNKLPDVVKLAHTGVKNAKLGYRSTDEDEAKYEINEKILAGSSEYQKFLHNKKNLTDTPLYKIVTADGEYALQITLVRQKYLSVIAPVHANVQITVNDCLLYEYCRNDISTTQYMRGMDDRVTTRTNFITTVTPSDMKLYTFLMLSALKILNPEHILLRSYTNKINKMNIPNNIVAPETVKNYNDNNEQISSVTNDYNNHDDFFTGLAVVFGLIALASLMDNVDNMGDSYDTLNEDTNDDSGDISTQYDESNDDMDFSGNEDFDQDMCDDEGYYFDYGSDSNE